MPMRILLIYLLALLVLLQSCQKEWLEEKPLQSLVVPVTLQDLQGLLDNTSYVFNQGFPALGEISCDDYYVDDAGWASLYSPTEKNAYIWAKELYEGASVTDWMLPYQQVFYSNYILETIASITPQPADSLVWNNIYGSALFCRAFAFYGLVTTFAKQYNPETASGDPGIPLRLQSDITAVSARASVKETYDRMITDLQASLLCLPSLPLFKTRPSKAAAYALLARIYLDMQDYPLVKLYADSCLRLQPALMDYNNIDATATYPFSYFNEEVIYHTVFNYPQIIADYTCYVDSSLYNSYAANDLRKILLVDTSSGLPKFKGGYDGYTVFAGLATDEVYLMHAEANARLNNVDAAMEDMDALLINRYRVGTFTSPRFTSSGQLLSFIFNERRKELLFRGLRWNDLRRLNATGDFTITLTRMLNGNSYTLPPNDPRYVMPIPQQEIELTGISQNPR